MSAIKPLLLHLATMMTTTLSLWAESIGDLFVMKACLACQTPLTRQESYVCMDCLEGLDPTHSHLSPCDNEMFKRIAGKVPLAGAYTMSWFDKGGALQHMLQALKYGGNADLGVWLGKLYGRKLSYTLDPTAFDAVVPVPLHPRKLRKRGYNQAEMIARGLAAILHLPVEIEWLHRVKFTKTQTRMSGQRRYRNVADAFVWDGPSDLNLLLVDDVITTGATLESCIRSICQPHSFEANISVASIGGARY